VRAGIMPRSLIWSQRRSHKDGTPGVRESKAVRMMASVAIAVSIGRDARSTPRLRHTCFLAPMMSPSQQKWVAREDGPRNTQGVKEGQGPHPTDFFLLRLAAD
jgi:hypothetical protein